MPQTQTQETRAPVPHKPIQLSMTSLQNSERLHHSQIRRICQIHPDIGNLCIMCDQPANPVYQCRDCEAAQYCSWGCKVDDAQHHVLVCSQWPGFSESPSQSMARMLVFPAQSTTPVFAWAQLKHIEGEASPRLIIEHPEFSVFTDLLFPNGIDTFPQAARMGCINECRALTAPKSKQQNPKPRNEKHVFRTSPLGHGLFVLEWLPPNSTNLGMDWINRSIQHTTSLPGLHNMQPGHTWLWTGPIAILSLDVSQTYTTATHTFTLAHVTMRDVRHALDFFTLNLRNPALPAVPSPGTSRFPYPIAQGIKVNEVHSPVARALGVTDLLEEVHVSRGLPPTNLALQGVSVLCAALGLAWVVRAVLCHGEELDWSYRGFYSDPPSFSSYHTGATNSKEAGDGDEDADVTKKGSVIPAVINVVYTADNHESTAVPGKKTLPRSGDGIVLLSASGKPLLKEHSQALLQFIQEFHIEADDKRTFKSEDFKLFWAKFKTKQKLRADVPSPYEVHPLLCDVRPGDTFAVCTDVFRLLLRRTPNLKMYDDGSVTFQTRTQTRFKRRLGRFR
ncbi:hypothetical protein N657DRAFT_687076 [Parathielavia appendiculata]|uniref:MYND-type domain-containing protein n=1 Tax=Parathielavia appendiculata TaxID=2587402 RepID=A0AAN6UBW2_9PEZI|nr:hypothetical protein N657DRAFT_687076 [Parathielavia appendiculata]